MDASSGSKGGQKCPNRHAAPPPSSYPITVTAEQVQPAGREPNRGWPPYSVLYPDGNIAEVIHDSVSNPKTFRNKAANEGRVAGTAMDPFTTALKAAGATSVDPGEFRALGEKATLLRPLMGRGFQVWGLPNRLARDRKQRHNWRLGARPIPKCSPIWTPPLRASVKQDSAK